MPEEKPVKETENKCFQRSKKMLNSLTEANFKQEQVIDNTKYYGVIRYVMD